MKMKDVAVWTATIMALVWAYTSTIKDVFRQKVDDDYYDV